MSTSTPDPTPPVTSTIEENRAAHYLDSIASATGASWEQVAVTCGCGARFVEDDEQDALNGLSDHFQSYGLPREARRSPGLAYRTAYFDGEQTVLSYLNGLAIRNNDGTPAGRKVVDVFWDTHLYARESRPWRYDLEPGTDTYTFDDTDAFDAVEGASAADVGTPPDPGTVRKVVSTEVYPPPAAAAQSAPQSADVPSARRRPWWRLSRH